MSSVREFNPEPNERLMIGGRDFVVRPHPSVPAFAFGQEGRKAFVFQVSTPDGRLFALKKFKDLYRVRELEEVCNSLARFADWPGLEVCARECLVPGMHDDALSAYPDLLYAVLMPWIMGSTWYDIVIGETPLTRYDALTFANATAQVLSALEESGLAHCDIAAPNVIINGTTGRAHLIDVEDMYAPGFSPPGALPAGTDGYAHQMAYQGLWEPKADRFAGAVLICEMAAWHHPDIRKKSDEEHYFGVREMQQESPRYHLMREVLEDLNPILPQLFDEAWFSETLDDCPPLKAWQEVIQEVHRLEGSKKVAPEWRKIQLPGSEPAPVEPEPIRQAEAREAAAPAVQAPAPVEIAKPAPPSPAPPRPAPAVQPAAQPGQALQAPSVGGPVKEWTPIAAPQPAASAPRASNGSPSGNRPIEVPAAPTVDEPVAVPIDSGAGIPYEVVETLETWGAPTIEVSEQPEDPGSPPENDIAESSAVFLKPLLDLQRIDNHNRPHLVWTESPGATHYLLQEDDNSKFAHPKEHKVKASETRWSPPLLWRRSGKLFYRIRAMNRDQSGRDQGGPWSDTLSLRIGES